MMKKYLVLPFLLMSSLFAYPRCSPELEPALQTIYRFPEGKKLLDAAEADGPVTIHWARFNSNSPAMWVTDDRAIVINANMRRPFGDILRSICFELHNAKSNKQFEYLDWLAENHRISKADYVESVERIEFQNACSTTSLINQAIELGYFPPNSRWYIANDFETHFRIQKQAGHSGKIAAVYDSIIRSRHTYYGCSR